jgi:hypothetical protein
MSQPEAKLAFSSARRSTRMLQRLMSRPPVLGRQIVFAAELMLLYFGYAARDGLAPRMKSSNTASCRATIRAAECRRSIHSREARPIPFWS